MCTLFKVKKLFGVCGGTRFGNLKNQKNYAGARLFGILCIRDRVVHTTIKHLLEPIIDRKFSDNSYGFRLDYSSQQAVEAAQKIVQIGKPGNGKHQLIY